MNPNWKFATALVPALALAAPALAAVTLEPGKTDVVVAPKAADPVLWAAEEATNFLSRVLGAAVPVVNAPRAGRTALILGENEWTKAAGLDAAKYPRDTYLIRTAPNAVFLCGLDDDNNLHRRAKGGGLEDTQRATSFAVYAFLEKFAGCRFYFPGEFGEVVPRLPKIDVPDTDLVSTPANLVRKYYNHPADGAVPKDVTSPLGSVKNLNWIRLKMATTQVPCCHGSIRFNIQERFAKSHPEYFALKTDGSRCNTFTGAPSSRHGHLCWSNRGLRDVFFNDCLARFAKGEQFVDVMANDAYPGCQCPGCQKMYNAKKYGAHDYATDLMWDFTAELANRLRAAGAKGKITQMAYGPYGCVPDFDIPNNVAVMVAVGGPWTWGDEKRFSADLRKIRVWGEKTGGSVWIWAYPHKYGATLIKGIPDVAPKAWGKYYRAVNDLIFGTFAESETDNWMYHYLNYYVFSRVMWDGKTCDVDGILDEHYRLMFGPAAAEMKAFYEILEDKWLHRMAGNVVVTEIGPIMTAPTESMMWNEIYSDAARAEMDGLLAKAAGKVAPGSLEAKRIALFRREYFDGFKDGVAEFRRKQAAVKKLRWNPGAGEKLTLNYYSGDKNSSERVTTTVAAARDGDNLVFTFDCEEPRMDDLTAADRRHDDPDTWKDSGVELFLNPSGDRRHYFHIIVNAKGSLCDMADFKPGRSSWGATSDIKWESNANVRVTPRANGWTTEVRIPVASLGEMKPEFPIEFLRTRVPQSGKGLGYYKWNMITTNSLEDLECFGTMVVPVK